MHRPRGGESPAQRGPGRGGSGGRPLSTPAAALPPSQRTRRPETTPPFLAERTSVPSISGRRPRCARRSHGVEVEPVGFLALLSVVRFLKETAGRSLAAASGPRGSGLGGRGQFRRAMNRHRRDSGTACAWFSKWFHKERSTQPEPFLQRLLLTVWC